MILNLLLSRGELATVAFFGGTVVVLSVLNGGAAEVNGWIAVYTATVTVVVARFGLLEAIQAKDDTTDGDASTKKVIDRLFKRISESADAIRTSPT